MRRFVIKGKQVQEHTSFDTYIEAYERVDGYWLQCEKLKWFMDSGESLHSYRTREKAEATLKTINPNYYNQFCTLEDIRVVEIIGEGDQWVEIVETKFMSSLFEKWNSDVSD
jgi:hypothetical protein